MITEAVLAMPRLREMTTQQCEELLSRNTVGRVAFTYQGRVHVIPIHYAFEVGWVYGRTDPGAKLRHMLLNRRIAFEVDEYVGYFDWSSAVVQGTFYVIEQTEANRSLHEHALAVLRSVFPETFTDSDPVPFRSELFRISVSTITGRSATPEGGAIIEPANAHVRDAAVAEDDRRLRNEVIGALGKLEDADPSGVVVDVMAGVVVLSGTVESFGDIAPIERAAIAVRNASVVINQIEVGFTREFHTDPLDLAHTVLEVLKGSGGVPQCDVHVVMETGWLRVEGTVPNEASRHSIVQKLRQIPGTRGLVDRVRIAG